MGNVTDEAAKESASRWAELLRFIADGATMDETDLDIEWEGISEADDDGIGVGYVDPSRWAEQAHTVEGGALWD